MRARLCGSVLRNCRARLRSADICLWAWPYYSVILWFCGWPRKAQFQKNKGKLQCLPNTAKFLARSQLAYFKKEKAHCLVWPDLFPFHLVFSTKSHYTFVFKLQFTYPVKKQAAHVLKFHTWARSQPRRSSVLTGNSNSGI